MHASDVHLKDIAFTCSRRSCRVWKDLDRSRVCRIVHTVNMALHTARDSASTAMSDQATRSVRIRLLWSIRCIVAHTGRLPFWSFHINHSVHIPREHLWASLVGPMRESFSNSERKCSCCSAVNANPVAIVARLPLQISRRWQCFGIWRTVCVYCMDRPEWNSNILLIPVQRIDSSAATMWV